MNKELGLELPEVPKSVAKYVPTSSSWISRGGDSRGHTARFVEKKANPGSRC